MNDFKARVEQALSCSDEAFDEAVKLIRATAADMHYHTRLPKGTPVHPTRESASYAFLLLESRVPWRVARGNAILRKLLSLQDTDFESRTYGIWSWYYEEPLEMMAPPDWNWADFIGTQLAQIRLRSRHLLEPDVVQPLDEALRHAARSIIRRNVELDYTNIAIMGTYVTIMTGSLLSDEEILAFGRRRLREFLEFTKEWGGFPEYNSPNYGVVALSEISRMKRDFTEASDQLLVEEINDILWDGISAHWHSGSKQWVGPHSRAYQTLLSKSILSFIERGLGRAVSTPPSQGGLEEDLLPVLCPIKYQRRFDEGTTGLSKIRIRGGEPRLMGVTYLTEDYALSSVEYGIFWNQARPLLAYSSAGGEPTALQVQFLRNDYDYSSATIFATQHEKRVLAGISFATDGGNEHCSLDCISGGRITAKQWRLRFTLFGPVTIADVSPQFVQNARLKIRLGDNAFITLTIPWAEWGEDVPTFEVLEEGGRIIIDLVLYRGEEKEFIFGEGFLSSIVLALEVGEHDFPKPPEVAVQSEPGRVKATWKIDEATTLSTAAVRHGKPMQVLISEAQSLASSAR